MSAAPLASADLIVSALVVLGGAFALIGSWGLVRLPTLMERLHGPTKATTLGLGGILLASVLWFQLVRGTWTTHELLVSVFLFMTAPISAYMMARAAFSRIQRAGGDASLPPPPPGMDASGGASGSSPAHSETQDDGAPSPRP